MDFEAHPLTTTLARSLRACARVTRPSIDGHGFSYLDLKELWASEDGQHVVLTHDQEQGWQYWRQDDSWALISLHPTRAHAQQAVQCPEPAQVASGTYMVASAHPGARVIRVRCTSADGPAVLTAIFGRLGYGVDITEIA